MTDKNKQYLPLAARMRPKKLSDYIGQQHLVGQGKPLKQAIKTDTLHSMIFWGPPGTGKTSLAKIIAEHAKAEFVSLSAVLSGVKEIRAVIETAKQRQSEGIQTVLFVDEVHRFNKSQQDVFLPHIEEGTITFIGATTENPSFELNNALLSRVRVYILKPLTDEDIEQLLTQTLNCKQNGYGELIIEWQDNSQAMLVSAAQGDARSVLNMLEILIDLAETDGSGKRIINEQLCLEVVTGQVKQFDKHGDIFHEQISAVHKSVRGSNPDAALYWYARMIEGGCDPLYIARRVVRMASEDIGNADPRALQLALNAWETYERLGSPEGELAIAHAITYLACVPKSNAVYMAYKAAYKCAQQSGQLDVPLHLKNAPTQLMKSIGYGRDYRYAHDEPNAYAAGENYFPESLGQPEFYKPTDSGLEKNIKHRMSSLKELDKKNQ